MELIVGATGVGDRFDWTIIYSDAAGNAPQERQYQLVTRNAATGEYAIDERNGIVLEARLLDGALYSHFLVQGKRIVTREKLEGAGTPDERIEVEMLVTDEESVVMTGGSPAAPPADGRTATPEVRTWMPRSIQRATLRRVTGEVRSEPAAR